MRSEMNLAEKIEKAFAHRPKPDEVAISDDVLQLDFEVEDALWFSARDWHELKWADWQEHSSAVYFFAPDAFAYYLPSILLLSAQNPTEPLAVADSLISQLDRSPDAAGWREGFNSSFLQLHPEEFDVLKEWLLQVCEYVPYKRWGIAASGPGDTFGRAYDTIYLLQQEAERRRLASG